ncbi:MAG: DNA-binding protein, partial [Desulfobacterales bacterium]|nr:DNA-binding protein [Desulfobacterales bacterium]
MNPKLLEWAIDRADIEISMLIKKFPKIENWLKTESQPTLKQLEAFAKTVNVPTGYLFLPEPPHEALPISDFRTKNNRRLNRLTPNLLDTIYLCQQRQDWFRDYARAYSLDTIDFVGSATQESDPIAVATMMRTRFNITTEDRLKLHSWTETFRFLVSKTEDAGVLVMSSSIVGSNSHRKLIVDEFRGFTLSDNY